jgi:hypothetical protein
MEYDDAAFAELSSKLRINRDMIDEELIAQAQHFWHVAQAHELAVSVADRKKHDFEILEAELDKEIREDMVANEEKVTEKLIEAAAKRDQSYQRAARLYLSAKRDAGRWSALRDSFRQRRDMLLEISRRSQQRFYDEVSGSGETRDARSRFERRR